MTTRKEHERLDDILAAILTVRAHSEHRSGSDVPARLVVDAVKYQLVTIGEAVADLSEATRGQRPEILWTRIKGMRDLLTHQYHRIDASIVWQVVDQHLTPLEAAVRALLAALPGAGLGD